MRRGDIYMVDLEPTGGSEQRGHRPVLIVSPDDYNKMFAPLVCPITSGGNYARNKGVAVQIVGGQIVGAVLCNQMRTLDVKAREGKRVEAVAPGVLQDVLWKLQAIVAD
jgi:mRNA interferase ChpB